MTFGAIKDLGTRMKLAPMLYLGDAAIAIAFFIWGAITAGWFIPNSWKAWQIMYWIYCTVVGIWLVLPSPNQGKRNWQMLIMTLIMDKNNSWFSI